jgi:hypothetical protein
MSGHGPLPHADPTKRGYRAAVRVLNRPEKLDSREAFLAYAEALRQSLREALANPSSPYGPAVDDHGDEWENTRLDHFLEAMGAWMEDVGWTPIDRRDYPVWRAIATPRNEDEGGSDALGRYLDDLIDWASNPDLPRDQEWAAAGQALRAGRAYE